MKVSMIAGITVIVVFLLFGMIGGGGSFYLFIDLPSIFIVFGILIGGVLISFGLTVPCKALTEALLKNGVKELDDLRDGAELKDFKIAEHDIRRTSERPLVSRLGRAIEVKPGFFGMSVNLKELFFGPTDPQA